MTGINQTKISMAENDLLVLTADEKKKIAQALGVSVNDIWAEVGTEQRCTEVG